MRTAYFDADGICLMVSEGPPPSIPFTYEGKVSPGRRAADLWFNPATSRARMSSEGRLPIPDVLNAGKPFTIGIPDGCVAFIDGARHAGELSIDTSSPRTITIDLRGRLKGTQFVEVRTYAEARAAEYPSIEEQLDMIYHGGLEPWRAEIAAVKAKHPKPGEGK